ncbi:MAG TPA: DoxX family protein [Phycisphaerae bacterium]|nr:DoxX family protein [Phycisphaerae bacterium]
MNFLKTCATTTAPRAVILIRLLVGWVFLAEGIGKFVYPAEQAAGRFAQIPAIPAPQVMGPFVAGVEVVFGALLLLGLLTRVAALVLLMEISVAIVTTKFPILAGHHYGMPALKHYGLWGMLHESRTDFSMWLGALFLVIVGAGGWSLDALLFRRGERAAQRGSTRAD